MKLPVTGNKPMIGSFFHVLYDPAVIMLSSEFYILGGTAARFSIRINKNRINDPAEFLGLFFNRPMFAALEYLHPAVRSFLCCFMNIIQRNERVLLSDYINDRHFQILQLFQIVRFRLILIR